MRLKLRSPTDYQKTHSYVNGSKQVYRVVEYSYVQRTASKERASSERSWLVASRRSGRLARRRCSSAAWSVSRAASTSYASPAAFTTNTTPCAPEKCSDHRARTASVPASHQKTGRHQKTKSTHYGNSIINATVWARDGMPFETDYLIGYELDDELWRKEPSGPNDNAGRRFHIILLAFTRYVQ